MAEQIKRKVPIQWIQTIKDDGTYEFNPDPNVYSTQKNVPSTSKIDFQNILINGTDPTNPLSSSYATSASYAQTASYVQTSQTASYVLNAISSSFATTASFSVSASRAVSSSFSSTSSFTPNAIVTASVSLNTITFTKGNGTTFPITVNTGSSGATSPGGLTTEIQYNNASAFAGTSTLTFDGTTITANPITATGYFIPQNALGSLTTVGGDYTITEPGIYRFTSMDSGGFYYIYLPNPTSKADGQTLIIINADTTYSNNYGNTYAPEDPGGTAISSIAASTADTFVNMEGIWIRTSRRP